MPRLVYESVFSLNRLLVSTLILGFAALVPCAAPSWAQPDPIAVAEAAGAAKLEAQRLEDEKRAERLLDHLRRQDQVLERWARQMTHPRGVGPTTDELRHFVDGLVHIGADVHSLAESYPDLEPKHRALVRRAREVQDAASLEKSARADLAPLAESVPWLEVPESARLTAGGSGPLTKAVCDGAASLGIEKRAVPSLDAGTEILARFVPDKDGTYRVDTAGSRTDTRLELLDGCSGKVLRSADDEVSLRARLEFEGKKDEPVWLRVGSDREGAVLVSAELLAEKGAGTASISGTVTALATGLPIANIRVTAIYGLFLYYADTDAEGKYSIGGMAAGEYRVVAEALDETWARQLWEGVDCLPDCAFGSGQPVVVAGGQAALDVDFQLKKYAVVTGTITDRQTEAPLSGAHVQRFEEVGADAFWRSTVISDALGRYRLDEILPQTMYVKVEAARFKSEVFDDLKCEGSCSVSDGVPISVGFDQVVTNIDFSLDPVSAVAGHVHQAANGEPVLDGRVSFYDAVTLEMVGFDYVDFAGAFYESLEPGSYLAVFHGSGSFESQGFDGIACPDGCDLSLISPFLVNEDEITTIGFEVLPLSSIEGTVQTTDGKPLATLGYVRVYDSEGVFLDASYVEDGMNSYETSGLGAGSYQLLADFTGFRNEWFDDEPCLAGDECDSVSGDPVAVAKNSSVGGIAFVLDRFGVIEGTVTALDGVTPIPNVEVIVQAAGGSYGSDSTDSGGTYRIEGLEPGSYRVRTSSLAALDELHDNVPCEGGCDELLATGVPVALNATEVVDFQLRRRGWIEGLVRDASTGDAVQGASVRLFDSGGQSPAIQLSNAAGRFKMEGLADGSYYLQVSDRFPYVGQVYDGITCADFESADCDPTAGTSVAVSTGAASVVELDLLLGGRIEGTIRTPEGLGLNGRIKIFSQDGIFIDGPGVGSAFSVAGLPAGDFYVVAEVDGYLGEVWPNSPCHGEILLPCDPTVGTAVSVSLGSTTAGIDFVLQPLAEISGTVKDSITGDLLPWVDVDLRDAAGEIVFQDFSETFQFSGVSPGTYYLLAGGGGSYLDQVHGGDTCAPSCEITSGTPIVVGAADVVDGLVIDMVPGPGFRGQVLDGTTGQPVAGVAIDLWDGNELQNSAISDSDGRYILQTLTQFSPETFVLSTHNTGGYTDLIHAGIECPNGSAYQGLCDPTQGTPLVVQPNTHLRKIDFIFDDHITIFTDGFESGNLTGWSKAVGN